MTGEEIIEYIRNNHLEDYTFIVSHETGESAYDVSEFSVDHDHKEVEIF